MDEKDLYWLAGLLEGEGCFHCQKQPNGDPCPIIQVGMSDEDVVQRAAIVLGGGGEVRVRIDPKGTFEFKKPIYIFRTSGQEAIDWMKLLHPLMGERRRAKIEEIIITWESGRTEKALNKVKKMILDMGYDPKEFFKKGGN